ncbi:MULTISPECIES: cellulose biosynthesis cyclic di-GMP-binding regulatory protein BcsB [Pseudomonas]|uniref:cellulose biosynthesis cyclic di-GMP-binding regulatory protein BcsB n=1 Tax=Pseudomonas TaxID=286 RepID=UPI0006B9A7E6|nr:MULTISPECIES: cellulose biosynthesis cyclic di-GMP-binding regulatory protein BcsB [Pseudomonas]KPB30830.1 Cyclic di-GMP binding protein [Pseudomonas syringae pv. syringae]MBC8877377.1 cellulose biosynthesis cyclic di-GMP-binding regulatory protein BcsB [Pseudomonas cerasi]MBC9742294.1 cellulose biosynthesis cyclic di-GMP-binding regulatory protein BcsB [Pseudomonas syringae pv. syringae]MBC9746415.1 cellulose biosynthesis cyclic di-GMP-binding regulatory protein BcsB [Pseudomonas syringae p
MTKRYFLGAERFAVRRSWALLACALSVLSTGMWASAAETTGANEGYSVTLQQLGRNYPMNLRGVEATDSVNFNVRADQVVTGASLSLSYSYSPALLADLSQINVMINDEVAATLPLPKEGAGKPQTQVIEIPPQMITEFNRLSLQFIGHYTMSCEDPKHSSLWARINNDTRLDIRVTPFALPNNLAILPLPFFDRRDDRDVNLPVVMGAAPDNATLEAAGALASWIGAAKTRSRMASFPAHFNELPAKGNALVLLKGDGPLQLGALTMPAPKGPTLTMVTHPNDPNSKLLVITGRDSAELKRAVNALVVGGQSLVGSSALIERVDLLAPRKPYDAPNWLPSDRPIKLGELMPANKLNVSGYDPGDITVPLNLPPDLFSWREDGVPLNLKYRYTPQERSNNSSIMVSLNDTLIKAEPLPSIENLNNSIVSRLTGGDDTISREAHVYLPLNSVALQSRLQLRYMFDYLKQGECGDIIIDNMRGSIDPESTLDFSGYDHFMAMPNLGVFKDSGFPFTRLADLSQTAVVLADQPSTEDVSAYLSVLGRFGESTGYPATGVSVIHAAQIASAADKDILVMSSGSDQPLLKQWADRLPISGNAQQQGFELSDLAFRLRDWMSPDPDENQRRARVAMAFSSDARSTFLTGFESPLHKGRSVVLISSGQPGGMSDVARALSSSDKVQGSLVVVRGDSVEALVAEQKYYVGDLGPIKYVQWLMSRNVLWLLLVVAVGVVLVTGVAYLTLRSLAKRRLEQE